MAALSQHLRILLWKNWLSVKRQPVWSFVLISWPVVVFIILAIIRLKFPPEPQQNCYLAPRNLPSAGFFPFLQTVLCDSDARCKGTPYTPEDLLPRLSDISSLRLKRRSSSSVSKDSHPSAWSAEVPESRNASLAFGDLGSHGEKTLGNVSSPSNLTSSTNMFNKILSFGKSQTQRSTAATLRVLLCEVLSRYVAHPAVTGERMAANIHHIFCFTDSSLLESFAQEFRSQLSQVQHNPQYQETFVSEMVSFLTLISQVQNDTSLWHLLLLAPDVFQDNMQLQDIIDFLQNPSSVELAAQNVSASLLTDDRSKTVQTGVTDLPYSLNCLEQDKEKSLVTRYICNSFVNWNDKQTLVPELEEVVRKIKSPEIGRNHSKRSINSDDLEAIQKHLHRLKGFEGKMNRSELKTLNLFRNLKNETLQKLYAFLELGMNPPHDYKLKEPYNKEIIDEIYNFTSLQLLSDFNGTSIFDIMTQWKEIQSALKLATMIWNPVLLNNPNFSTLQTKDALKMLLSTSMASLLEDFRDRSSGMQETPSLFSDDLLKPVSYRNFPEQLQALERMFFVMTGTNVGYQYLLLPVFELMRGVERSVGEAWWDELNVYWRLGEKLRSMKWNNTGIIAYGQFLEVLNSHLQKLNNNSSSVFSEQLDQLSEFITGVFKEFGESSGAANISLVTQAIQKTLYILKDLQLNYNVTKLKSIDLFFNFDNKTFKSLSELLRKGMKILRYLSDSEASREEIMNPVYNLTHLLLQEFSQSSLQPSASLEAKIWEFLHSALSPFLENSNNGDGTLQNCSFEDVLHMALEMLFENTTLRESLAKSPCKPLFDSTGMEGGTVHNDSFAKVFQLAIRNLKVSPEFASLYKNSSERFSKELSCITQSLHFSLSFLSKLNLMSELENSWVQEKARALTAVTEGLLQSNVSCPIPVHDVLPSQLVSLLIPAMLNETVLSSLNFSDSSADWHGLPVFSHLLPAASMRNSSIDELLQVGRGASTQSEWGHFSRLWRATGNVLTSKWNLTEVGEYVKLLEIMKKALILVDFGVAPGRTLVRQIFHNSSEGMKSSDPNDLYGSSKLFFNSTSSTDSMLDLERIFQEILPLYEGGGEEFFYSNPYGKENQDVLTMATVIWNEIISNRTHFNTEDTWEVIKMIALDAVSLKDIENYLSTDEKVSSLFSDFLLAPGVSENFTEHLLSLEQLLSVMAEVNTSDHYLLISSLSKLMQKLLDFPPVRQSNELRAFWHIAEGLQSVNWNSTDSLTPQSLRDLLQNQFNAMEKYSSLPFGEELKQLLNFASSMLELSGEEHSKGTNISTYLQAMQRSISVLKGLQKRYNISELEIIILLFDTYSNYTQRLIEIGRAGMKVLHDTNSDKTLAEKMDIVYDFSHLLLQEFSQSSLQPNASLEAKIWEFLHSALSPFLENSNDGDGTLQNCSFEDVLHMALEMLFENTTLRESLAKSPCKPLFDSTGMEGGTVHNDSFAKVFQLAVRNLKVSPEFASLYKNSSERFSKELSCITQSLHFSLSFLSKLNLMSELENSWVQEKARALTAVTEGLLQSNVSCPIPVHDVLPSQLVSLLIPAMLNETVLSSLNFSDSSADWHGLPVFSHLLPAASMRNSSIDELLQVGRGASTQSEWGHFSRLWRATGNVLTSKWNLTEVGEYVKLLEIMKKALILVDFGVAPGRTLVRQIFHNSSEGMKSSDPNDLYGSSKLFFNSTSSTDSMLDLERIFQEILPLYEGGGEEFFYSNPYGKENQDVLTMATVIWNEIISNRTHFNTEDTWEVIKMIALDAVSLKDIENYLSTDEKVSSLFSDFLLAPGVSENFTEHLLSLEQLLSVMAEVNTSDHYLLISSLSKLMQKLLDFPPVRQSNELRAFWHIAEGLQSVNWNSTDSLTPQSLRDLLQNQFNAMEKYSSLPFGEELKQLLNFASSMLELSGEEHSKGTNISTYLQAMQRSISVLKGLQKRYNISELEIIILLFDTYSNYTQRLIEIGRAGMKVLHDTNSDKTLAEKMDIVYDFSHLLLQEFSQSSLQPNASLEAKIWEFLHSALSPFLENSNDGDGTLQNCSFEDVLHMALEMLFENTTLRESLAKSPCKPLFDSTGMEGGTVHNDSFAKVFQLAVRNLKVSPEFASLYKNSSERFSKELSCITQSLHFSLSFLSKLNLMSELENSWVQEKARALTAVTEGLLQSNVSCPIPVHDVLASQLVSLLIPAMLNETVLSSLNFSGTDGSWSNLSMLFSVAHDELHVNKLLQRLHSAFSLPTWSSYTRVWDVANRFLNTKKDQTEAAAFAKLLRAVANNSFNEMSAQEIAEASLYILKGLNFSDLLNELNISSTSAFHSNNTSFDSVIDIISHHFVVVAETLYNKTLPWSHSDHALSPTGLIARFLFLEFENTLLQVTVNDSCNPYLKCLINAAEAEDEELTENITLLLKQTHLKKNSFMQNNTSEKHSSIPELLKLKISRLRDLTALLCDYESFQSVQQLCLLPEVGFAEVCERGQSHEQLLRTVELSSQVVTDVLNHRRISQELQNVLIGDTTNIQTQLNWLQENVPEIAFFQEIPQYMATLNSMLNITESLTNSSKQEKLRDVLRNVDQLKEDLKNTTGMSAASIDALLETSLPENSSQLVSQLLQLESCSVRPADPQLRTVAEELCKLSLSERTRGTYILGVTLLRHLDVYNFLYKMFFPKELQQPMDKMLGLLTKMKYFRHQVESGVDPLLQAIHSLKKLRQSRKMPLTKALFKPATFRITRGTFKSMSKVLCNQEITPLFFESLLPDFGDPISNSSDAEDVYVQNLMRKYGIPRDSTPFCLSFYLDLVKTPTGALIWSFLKPMVLGKILFTPDTPETRAIMRKSNATLEQMADLALKSQEWLDKSPVIINSLAKLNQTVPMIKNTLQNPFVQVFIKMMVDLDAAELLSQINELDDIRLELQNNSDIVDQLNTLATLAVNVSSCVSFNRVQAVKDLEEMEMVAKQLFLKNELFASIIFKLPTSHSSPGSSVPGALSLPPVLNYTIRMSSRITQTTNRIRERIWTVGPHNSTSQSQIYSRAFIYIQDSIERAIIELQTGKKPEEIAVQVQAMPYPCYNKDMFLTSVTYSLPFALMAAWVLFIADFVKTLVQEKDLRLYEYMKMMGVNASSHFIAWFVECAIFLLITVTFLIIVLKVGDILPKTNTTLLFLYLMDYSLSIIAMSYFISVFFNNTNIAALVGSLVYILTFFPFIVLLVIENHLSFSVKSLLSLLSPTAFSYASQYIARYEAQGIGLQWDNMYKSPMIGDNTSFGWMCWLILIDSFIYFVLGWYIRNVFPGRYGMAAPWYFPLLPSYWIEYNGYLPFWNEKQRGLLFSRLMLRKEVTLNNKICAPHPHLEPEPTDLPLGVSLHGITKVYGSKAAVDNLSLNFYEGNITSLLGHNGAGKTTTISILTGLFPTSSGTIFVCGKDIRTDQEVIRKNMGVCMQHNVLFNYLTTKEHLLLYGYIKVPHWSKEELYQEVKRTLKETGLYSHRHKLAGTLSGGMKRKLSIAIALLGGSRVVILDEPTTGVDPCSRRSIWEIISKNKKGRTIILSTHHLDEAEVLSDRIAFLEHGGLKCCGSPFYLKETFGDGYHLTLTKKKNMIEECDTSAVTSFIQSHLPEAYLKEDIGGELVYVLPPFKSTVSGAYQALLRALDSSLNDLHLGCYGISNTTVEEVFLNLTKDLVKDQQEDAALPHQLPGASGQSGSDGMSVSTDTFTDRDDQLLIRSKSLQGLPLLLKKTSALFIKRFHHTRRDVRGFIAQVILPVLFVMAAMGLGTLRTKETEYPELLLSPSLYGTSDQADFFGNFNETTGALVASMLAFPGTDNTCMNESNSQCLTEDMLGQWITSGNQETKYSACNCTDGIQTCPQTNYTPPHRRTFSTRTLYNLTGHNMESYILATTKDFLQKRYGGWSFGMPLTSDLQFDIRPVPPNRTLTKVWYNPEGYHSLPAYLNSLNNFILRANLPKNETSKYGIFLSAHPYPGGQSQEQVMLNSLLDIIVSMSVLVGYSITTASFVLYMVKEHQTKAKQLQHISGIGMTTYWVTNFVYDLVLFMVPVGLSIGVISAFQIPAFCNNSNLLAVFLLLLLFGYASFSWMYLLAGFFKETGMAFIVYVCVNLFFGINTIITHSVVFLLSQEKATDQGLRDLAENLRHAFLLFPQFCFGYGLIELSQDQALLGFLKAYGVDYPDKTFELDKTTSKLFAMFIQGTVFFAIRLAVHDRMIQRVWNNVLEFLFDRVHGKGSLLPPVEEDGDVQAERSRVEAGKADFDVVQLQNLTKIYHLPHKRIVAVKNISLGIPAGECFGLLGVNGAGKTTIFKMLTGDIGASSGRLRVQDHSGSLNDISEAHWSLFGYCPQEDALDDLLTVEEHMYYYARLHGIPERDIKGVVLQLLHRLNLMAYKDRVSSMCSYGTNRKLSTALALIGNPSILLLDEPSSGMDPNAKRHLWKIISEEVQNKCSVILTSHSMEECEALCTRLAIMVNGSFQCIGSLQHIKSRFGRGFTVKMHLNSNTVCTEVLTEFMKSHFPNTCLKDRHFNMVEYHVPVSAGGVANIFDLLEGSKAAFDIRHFSVSQTTLEEVFINFAKDQADPDSADAGPDVTVDSSDTSSQASTISSIY